MKNHIFRLLIMLLITACSSDDSNENNISNFSITIEKDKNIAAIDEVITITISANDSIRRIDISKDGWQTSTNMGSDSFGDYTTVYIDYESTGNKTISIKATNHNGDTDEQSVNIIIERGNAIKLKELQLNSFYNINETWDAEYGTTNPERLADVFYVLLKPRLNPFNGSRTIGTPVWYKSIIRANQDDLFWSMQAENLYFNPNIPLYIAFADADGGGIVEDLMLGPPFEREISFQEFSSAETNPIPFNFQDINLNFNILVEW